MRRMISCVGFALALLAPVVVTAAPVFLRAFGATGAPALKLASPTGFAFTPQGTLAIADGGKNRIVWLSVIGTYVAERSVTGFPLRGLAIVPSGDIFACSNLSPYVKNVGPAAFTEQAAVSGPVYGITDDPSGWLAYSEIQTALVWTSWALAQLPAGSMPAGLDVDGGEIFIACAGDHRVRVIVDGAVVREWGGLGSGPGQFRAPQGVTAVGDVVYVSDTQNHRVQRFTRAGAYLDEWGTRGTGPGQFVEPVAVLVSAAAEIYVLEFGGNRVQVFAAPSAVAASPTTWGRLKALWH